MIGVCRIRSGSLMLLLSVTLYTACYKKADTVVMNKVTMPATINVQGGKSNALSKFNVALAACKTEVPSLVSKQVV